MYICFLQHHLLSLIPMPLCVSGYPLQLSAPARSTSDLGVARSMKPVWAPLASLAAVLLCTPRQDQSAR